MTVEHVIEIEPVVVMPVPSGGSAGGGDTTPPAIQNITPASGEELSRLQPVQFDVVDTEGFGRIMVFVKFAFFEHVVYDGAQLSPGFRSRSSVEVIADGFRFRVVPDTGWPALSAPRFRILAVDAAGNEATL